MRRLIVLAIAVLAALGVLAWLSIRGDTLAEHGAASVAAHRDTDPSAPPMAPARRTPAAPPRSHAPPSELPDPADPSRPTYDADAFVRANPGQFREQFHREPRDEPWATHREVLVRALSLQRLREVDPAANLEIECHTAICKLTVSTKNQALDHWLGMYPLGTCLAPTYASTTAGDMYLVFDPTTRDPDGLISASDKCEAERHDQWLSAVRAGLAPWEVPKSSPSNK